MDAREKDVDENCDAKEVTDDYIKKGLKNGTIKICPFCGWLGELASGCNYIKCPAPVGVGTTRQCNGEWCWVCYKPKYKVIPNKENLGFCDDKKHNSH